MSTFLTCTGTCKTCERTPNRIVFSGSIAFLYGSGPFFSGPIAFPGGSYAFLSGTIAFFSGPDAFSRGSITYLSGTSTFFHGTDAFFSGAGRKIAGLSAPKIFFHAFKAWNSSSIFQTFKYQYYE